MANTLGVYNPIFYANEALIHLRKNLGMAQRVYRAFDAERRSFGLGDTIKIRRPSTFSVENAPDTTPQDLVTETVTVTLDQWKEVKFKLTDKELAYTGDRIISDHIAPAAYALGDNIDQALADKTIRFPHAFAAAGDTTLAIADILTARKTMFDNQCPMNDLENLHLMVGGSGEADLLALSAFSQQQGAGDLGVNTQLTGSLGRKFGFEIFASQNVTGAVTTSATDLAGAIDLVAGYPVGSTTIHLDGLAAAEAYEEGMVFTIAGDTQKYTLTADTTTASSEGDFNFEPGLKVAADDDDVVTFEAVAGQTSTIEVELAFHRNALALVTVPLPELPEELGAKVAVATDPVSGLSVRSRIYYVGLNSEVHVALDVLYGVQVLDHNMGVRIAV